MKMVVGAYDFEVIAPTLIPRKQVYRPHSRKIYAIHFDHDAVKTKNSPSCQRIMKTFMQKGMCVAQQAKLGKAAVKDTSLNYGHGLVERRLDIE
jgi:hypothetical protein